MLTRVGDTV